MIACLIALVTVFVIALRDAGTPPVETTAVHVMANQTLWHLASEYPIEGLTTAQTVEHIKRANNLVTSNIAEGDEILVPVSPRTITAVASR